MKATCDDGPLLFVLSVHGQNKMMYRLQVSVSIAKLLSVITACIPPLLPLFLPPFFFLLFLLLLFILLFLLIHLLLPLLLLLKASSKSVKDMWVSEVKRLLDGQFDLLKGI